MQIVYGTGNQAKLAHMRRHLEPLGLTLIGLDSFDPLPPVPETGRTPLQNARLKAHAYYRMLSVSYTHLFSSWVAPWVPRLSIRRLTVVWSG